MEQGREELSEQALAEAYRHEDAVADAASQTAGMAWLFAIVPAGLVLLVLSALLGDWLWRLLPVLAIAAMVAPLLARVAVRWRSDCPWTCRGTVGSRASGRSGSCWPRRRSPWRW